LAVEKPHPLSKYIRKGAQTHSHCPGCGNGIIAQSFLRAIDKVGISKEKIVCVAGIGCSGWIPSPFFDVDTLHVTHGRPIAFATGVKLGNPELEVVVFTGDGDASAIGGNHLIHAARRNIGVKVICVNNMIYGMTGGEVAPTTPRGMKTTTTPFGNLERPFDLSKLVIAAGGTYVARWTTYHVTSLVESMSRVLTRNGFAFLEVLSHCPVHFGRRIGITNPVEMMLWFQRQSVTVEKSQEMTTEELSGKFVVGKFQDIEVPELTGLYAELFEAASRESN
jgi:2-oxoglutarate/2-oxoacid ferredoxin oxidoreductase subunit beta